jgi:uncharacterized protein YjiS (DUF1127 family)
VQESRAGGAPGYGDSPLLVDQRRETTSSETTRDQLAIPAHEGDAWAHQPLVANGFDDAAATELPTSYGVIHTARRNRALMLGALTAAAIQGAAAIARRVYAHLRQRWQARATYESLQQLGDYELRDLGFHRSELESIAAEVTGAVEPTRTRAWRMLLLRP